MHGDFVSDDGMDELDALDRTLHKSHTIVVA